MDQEMDSAAERQRPTTSSDFESQPSDALGKLQMAIFIGGAGRGSSVVEQPIRNWQVVGSTPTLGSRAKMKQMRFE